MTIRIYGKTLNKWYITDASGREQLSQVEREYREYDSTTGRQVGYGTEDIQMRIFGTPQMNWQNRQKAVSVYTWDGQARSKGYTNNRTFQHVRDITYRPEDGARAALRQLLKVWYPDAADIQVRG